MLWLELLNYYLTLAMSNVTECLQSRVKLKHEREDIYINACHVNVPEADRQYILTQGKHSLCLTVCFCLSLLSRQRP